MDKARWRRLRPFAGIRTAISAVLGVALVGGAALYLAFFFDPGVGFDLRPELAVAVVALLFANQILAVAAEYLVLRKAGMADAGFFAVYRVASIASLSTYFGVLVGAPTRFVLYRTVLRVPLANAAATFVYLTAISTAVPLLLGVLFLAGDEPGLALGAAVALVLLAAAFLLLCRNRQHGDVTGAGPRPRLFARVARFANGVSAQVAAFGAPLTIVIALLQVLLFVALGLMTTTLLAMWHEEAPFVGVLGAQAASFALGRLSTLPLGLGVRDASLVALLAQQGVDTDIAVSVAAADRVLQLVFRSIMAGLSMLAVRR